MNKIRKDEIATVTNELIRIADPLTFRISFNEQSFRSLYYSADETTVPLTDLRIEASNL